MLTYLSVKPLQIDDQRFTNVVGELASVKVCLRTLSVIQWHPAGGERKTYSIASEPDHTVRTLLNRLSDGWQGPAALINAGEVGQSLVGAAFAHASGEESIFCRFG